MTSRMTGLRFSRRGRNARRAALAPGPLDPLAQMALHIRELDLAAKQAAERIAEEARRLRESQPGAGSANRAGLTAGVAAALVERTDEIRRDCERLSGLMDRTAKLVAERDAAEGAPQEQLPAARPPDAAPRPYDPGAQGAIGIDAESRPDPVSQTLPSDPPWPGRGDQASESTSGGTSEGVRLIATQMAIAGSSRAEIEHRLRIQFGVVDAEQALDGIFGNRRSGVE